jgi:hypothetical protein
MLQAKLSDHPTISSVDEDDNSYFLFLALAAPKREKIKLI